jgi:hypothetical protein
MEVRHLACGEKSTFCDLGEENYLGRHGTPVSVSNQEGSWADYKMYHSCVVRKAGYLHLFKDANTTREIILVKRLYNYDDSHNLLKASVTTSDGKWEAKPIIEND